MLTDAWYPLYDIPDRTEALRGAPLRRFTCIQAGRQSGKTEIARRWLVSCLLWPKPWPDPRYFFAADTVGHAKAIVWEALLRLIPPQWLQGKPRESASWMEIRTVFGASLRVFGMQRPQCVEGLPYDGGIIDESADVPPGAFDRSVRPALAVRDGWAWRIGVPKRFGIGAREFNDFYDLGRRGDDPAIKSFTWKSAEVLEQVNPGFLAEMRRTMDPCDYREQFEASREAVSGRAFYPFDRAYNVRKVIYDPVYPLVVGMDFNVDPMHWVLCQVKGGERLEVFDELFMRNTNTSESLTALWSRYGQHVGGWQFYGDAASRQRHTSASEADYALIFNDRRFASSPGGRRVFIPDSNPMVRERLGEVNALCCNAEGVRRLFVDPACTHLIDDFDNRPLPGLEAEQKSDYTHGTDAVGYVVHARFPTRFNLDGVYSSPAIINVEGSDYAGLRR